MGLLPELADGAALDRCRNDEKLWRPAMAVIADRHGLPGDPALFPTGSAVVFAIGDHHVVKLHEPWNHAHFAIEADCLERLASRPIPVPRLHATGELEGWRYLVMERLPGQPLCQARDQLSGPQSLALAEQIGRLAAEIQAVPVPGPLPEMMPWDRFLAGQRENCLAHHRAYGLPQPLLASLDQQLAGVDLTCRHPVLLHTELTDTNLMVDHDHAAAHPGDRSSAGSSASARAGSDYPWHISGVFDFEPAMVGHPHYDLPAIAIFVARGDPRLCRAALAAYGITRIDDDLRRELLALTLLHRYSWLDFFLAQVGVDEYPSCWDEIAARLFGF